MLKEILNEVLEYYLFNYEFDNEKRFQKIVNLLLEIKENIFVLKDVAEGNI